LFDGLPLGVCQAAATIGGAELDAPQFTLTEKLTMPKAAGSTCDFARH
jgi:hypothetical protein